MRILDAQNELLESRQRLNFKPRMIRSRDFGTVRHYRTAENGVEPRRALGGIAQYLPGGPRPLQAHQ